MTVALKPLHEQVMVITGATSGIGLATARSAAKQGARLVLTARNEKALEAVAHEIAEQGGRAIYVKADVAKREELRLVAEAAIANFGRIDTWVNNAGVSVWARLDEISEEDARRLFDVNFWGTVNGSLIAARHLREHGGALINVGSLVSDVAVPIQGIYSASKHAVKGFTEAFRAELERDGAPISVTLIKPTSIDTPLPQRSKNYTGKRPKLPSPAYTPEEVAYAILGCAVRPRRDLFVGDPAAAFSAFHGLAPRTMDWINENYMYDEQFTEGAPYDTPDTLHEPHDDLQVRGEHPGAIVPISPVLRATLHPWTAGALALVAGLAAMTFVRGRT